MNKITIWKIIFALAIFSPPALLPASSRAALLASQIHPASRHQDLLKNRLTEMLIDQGVSRIKAEESLNFLSPQEIKFFAGFQAGFLVGGETEGITESLESNETVAIVLTAIMLAVVVGFVEINRH